MDVSGFPLVPGGLIIYCWGKNADVSGTGGTGLLDPFSQVPGRGDTWRFMMLNMDPRDRDGSSYRQMPNM